MIPVAAFVPNQPTALRLTRARAILQQVSTDERNERPIVSLGDPALDARLPWGGLPRIGLHEIQGLGALGWALALAGRALRDTAAGLLFLPAPGELALYSPGVARFGLAPERLMIAETKAAQTRLWALEEALRSGAFAVVLAEAESRDLTVSRRLHLAAEAGECMALLLCRAGAASAALTRWHAAPACGQGAPVWRVALQRCRGGRPSDFIAGWDRDALRLHSTALLGD